MPASVAVVVPTFRRPAAVEALLRALEEQTLDPSSFEVLLVDDHSPVEDHEAYLSIAAASGLDVRVVRNPTNTGPAAARNLGWRSSDAPVVAFTDDDCLPGPGWLAALLSAMANPAVGIVQGRTERPADRPMSSLGDWSLFREVLSPSPYFEGCNLAVRREALEASGGFDEDIRYYFEDTALGWGVLEAGWARGFADDAVVVHEVQERGVGWHVRNGWTEQNMVRVAARFPEFRAAACWRSWAFRRENAAVTVAWFGLLLSLRWRPALLLVAPWLRWRWPPPGHRRAIRLLGERFAVDSAQAAGLAAGSIRHRTVLL